MKWSIYELNKYRLSNYKFDYIADFRAYITDELIDVIDISPVEISGSFTVLEAFEQYMFDVNVKCTITLACAISLKPVEVPMDFQTSLIFSKTLEDDNVFLIDGITIDLDPYIWAEILIEKPMRVVADDAYESYSEEIVTLDEEELNAANPFGKLKH